MLKYTENIQVLARRKVLPWLVRVPIKDIGRGSGGQERMKLLDFQGDFFIHSIMHPTSSTSIAF